MPNGYHDPTFGEGAVPPTQAGDWNREAVSPTGMPTPSVGSTQTAGAGNWIRQLAPLLSMLPLLLRRGGTGEAAAFLSGMRESQQEQALSQHAARQETEGRRRFEAEFGLRTAESRRADREGAARNEKDYLEAVAQVAETASGILDETQRQAYLTRMTTLLEERWPQKRTRQILRDIQASPEAVRKWAQDTLDRFLKTHPSIGEHPDAANVEIQTPLGGKSLSEIMRMAGVEGLDPKTGKPIRVAKPPKEERDPLGTGVSAEAARARIAAFEERHGREPTAAEEAELLEPPKADTPAEQRATRKEQQAEARADLRAAVDAGEPLDAFPARFRRLGLNYARELAAAKKAQLTEELDTAGKLSGLERNPLTGLAEPERRESYTKQAREALGRGATTPASTRLQAARRYARAEAARRGLSLSEAELEAIAQKLTADPRWEPSTAPPRLLPSH